jgi:hypothetical protein
MDLASVLILREYEAQTTLSVCIDYPLKDYILDKLERDY